MVVETCVSLEELRSKFPNARIQVPAKGQVEILAGDKQAIWDYLETMQPEVEEVIKGNIVSSVLPLEIKEPIMATPEPKDVTLVDEAKSGEKIVAGLQGLVAGMMSKEMGQVKTATNEFIVHIDKLKVKGEKMNEQTLLDNAKTIESLRLLAGNCLDSVKALESSFDSKLKDLDSRYKELGEKNRNILVNFFTSTADIAKAKVKELKE